jgi:hypothetical protein
MPLKLNVGVSRKVPLPDYGSVGAFCNPELELDAALLERDLDGFQTQIPGANLAACQAVQNKMEWLQTPADCEDEVPAWTSERGSVINGSTLENRNCHSRRYGETPSRGSKPARPSQVRAILAIARSQRADLAGLLRQEFNAERPKDLTVKQASNLIDLLKNSEWS